LEENKSIPLHLANRKASLSREKKMKRIRTLRKKKALMIKLKL
jgi:hypothetical protein